MMRVITSYSIHYTKLYDFMKVIIEGINGALKGFNKLVEGVNKIFGTKFSTANLFDAVV